MRKPWTRNLKSSCLTGSLLIAGILPFQAHAALGEPEASVATDVQQFQASVKSTLHASYRVHEIQLPSGTLLREFAVPGGNVFAVAWKGPAVPNLRQALGQYFDVYVGAAKLKRGGRTHIEVHQDDLIVQSGGHMRAFSGRAYLAQAIPAGTSTAELH
jgi:hypothetical protein